MGRKARFTNEDFLEAALALLADKGPGGVTIAAIADKIGAPVGSVYHRFASREILLAELWVELIESFQAGFLEELNKGDGQKAALHTLKWVKKHPNQARVFLLYRREELIAGDWPGSIKDRVANLISELDAGLTGFTRHFLGKASKKKPGPRRLMSDPDTGKRRKGVPGGWQARSRLLRTVHQGNIHVTARRSSNNN